MEEIWKDIPGYEGIYQISSLGNVKSLTRTKYINSTKKGRYTKTIKGKFLRPGLCIPGYLQVCLYKDFTPHQEMIHRLVAFSFLLPVDGRKYVNHKNHIKTDNRLENLEWVTNAENMLKASEAGKVRKGLTHSSARIVFDTYTGACYYSILEYAKIHKIRFSVAYYHLVKSSQKRYSLI